MATVVVICMVLFSLTMAEQHVDDSNLDGLWVQITSGARNPFQRSSTPCVVRGRPSVRRDDYTYTPNVGAHKFHTRKLPWNEARRTCEEEGGHLAIINSVAESNAIAQLYKKSGYTDGNWAYIGFHDFYKEGEYITIHGQSIAEAGFTGWGPGEPNGGTRENCGAVDPNSGLNDIQCDIAFGYICELPLN